MKGTAVKLPTYQGPDWTDVSTLMRELQEKSSGTVEVRITTPADRYAGPFTVQVKHTWPHLTRVGKAAEEELVVGWPNHMHAQLSAAIYWQVFALFDTFAELLVQSELPFEE